jgi:reactive intermediate/imine deaminase
MTEREELRVPGLPEPISHYTDAVRFGDLLLVSGCAPLDEFGDLVAEGDIAGQTRQVLESMDRILGHAGASFADVLKVTVFMTDVSQRREANTVRQEFFGAARPASTLIEVSALAVPGMLIEIEAIVGLPGRGAN